MTQQADAPFLNVQREVVDGYLYETASGKLVIDKHPTDEAHLRSKATHAEQPLYRCRTYIDELIPKDWFNKPGKILIDKIVTTTGDVVSVALSFIPQMLVDDPAKRG